MKSSATSPMIPRKLVLESAKDRPEKRWTTIKQYHSSIQFPSDIAIQKWSSSQGSTRPKASLAKNLCRSFILGDFTLGTGGILGAHHRKQCWLKWTGLSTQKKKCMFNQQIWDLNQKMDMWAMKNGNLSNNADKSLQCGRSGFSLAHRISESWRICLKEYRERMVSQVVNNPIPLWKYRKILLWTTKLGVSFVGCPLTIGDIHLPGIIFLLFIPTAQFSITILAKLRLPTGKLHPLIAGNNTLVCRWLTYRKR